MENDDFAVVLFLPAVCRTGAMALRLGRIYPCQQGGSIFVFDRGEALGGTERHRLSGKYPLKSQKHPTITKLSIAQDIRAMLLS